MGGFNPAAEVIRAWGGGKSINICSMMSELGRETVSASDFVNGRILYVDGGILAYIGKQPQGN